MARDAAPRRRRWSNMRARQAAIAAMVLFLAAAGAAGGALPEVPVLLKADLFAQEGTNILYAIGHVRLQRGEAVITADAAVIWTASREAYLEGHIVYRTGKSILESQRAYVHWNLVKEGDKEKTVVDRGFLVDTNVLWAERSDQVAWRVRAEEVLQTDIDHFIARGGVTLAPCDFHEPHAFFRASEVELVTNEKLIATEISYYVRGVSLPAIWVPPIYWPKLYIPLGWRWPEMNFDFGSSSRFGTYVSTEVIYKVPQTLIPKLETDVSVRLDAFSRRGFAYGGGFHYRMDERYGDRLLDRLLVRGTLDGYRLLDDAGKDFNRYDLGTTDRYRLRFIHSMDLPSGLEFDVEFQKYSDAGFRQQFFEREYEQDKDIENRIYLKYAKGPFAAYLHTRWQENKWLDTTEYLPQVGMNVFSYPIWRNLLYTGNIEIANVRRRLGDVRLGFMEPYDDTFRDFLRRRDYFFLPRENTLQEQLSDGRDFWRFNMYHQLSFPFTVSIFHLEPFVGYRGTYYSETLDPDEGHWRSIFVYGGRASTEFWRSWDNVRADHFPGVPWLPLDINGIRHVVTPEVRFLAIARPSIGADKLILTDDGYDFSLPVDDYDFPLQPYFPLDTTGFAFGDVDSIRPVTLTNVALRNRWQTRRGGLVVDFLDLDASANFYSDPGRDNQGHGWSDLRVDLRFVPVNGVQFFAGATWGVLGTRDSDIGPFDLYHAGLLLTVSDRWQLFLSHRYVAGEANRFGARIAYQLNEKWRLLAEIEHDTQRSNTDAVSLRLVRDLHDWIAEFVIENDRLGFQKLIGFRLRPKMRRELVSGLEYTRDLRAGMELTQRESYQQYDY